MRTDIRKFGQLDQDWIILGYLNQKRNGFFVDIGCGPPCILSNSARLEMDFGWSGIAIDIRKENDHYTWQDHRPNTKLIIQDALSIDYESLFDSELINNNQHNDIDFLSLDLEPPQLTMDLLYKLPWHKWKPKVIAFETDSYRPDGEKRDKDTIDFMHSLGYSLRAKLYPRLEHLLLSNCECQDHIYVRHDIVLSETNR